MDRKEALLAYRTNPDAALYLFTREGVFSEDHKKVLRKGKMISYTSGMWVLTDDAVSRARTLGYLD